MAEEKKPDAVAEVGRSAQIRYLIGRLRDEREAAARHKVSAEEIRDELMELVWAEPDPASGEGGTEAALINGGFAGLTLTLDDTPALRVTARRPKRFDKAAAERKHPGLTAEFTREADSPEVRLEFP